MVVRMRSLSLVEFVTLDGVMQSFHAPDPDDPDFPHVGWGHAYQDPTAFQSGTQGQAKTSAYLFGRKTYQELVAFWPGQPDENPMAAHLNHTPKYVATHTLSNLDWENAHVLDGELVPAVQRLKAEGEGSIAVLGSGALAQQLLAAGLVDDMTLFVHPLVLGAGRRLFGEQASPMPLRLDGVTQTSTGVLIQTYTAA
jgi:dihydrofolate reductase